MNGFFNNEELIGYWNIYYQGHKERMKINVISGQKQSVILGILWLACYNPEIDWRAGEVKMTRCSEKYSKQQRPKQRKLEQQKQKEEEKKGKKGKK